MSRRLRLHCLAISWKGVGGSRSLTRLESSHMGSLSPVSLLYTSSELTTPMCNPFAEYGKVLFLTHNGDPSRSSSSLHRETARSRLGAVPVICQRTSGDTHHIRIRANREQTRSDGPLLPPDKLKRHRRRHSKTPTCSTLAQLYVASEVRGGSSDESFSHENQIYRPYLSENDNLRSNTKSDLGTLLE